MLQTVHLGHGLCLSIKIFAIPQTNSLILAAGLDDSSIKLFVKENLTEGDFVEAAILKRHEDWVRGLDFYANPGVICNKRSAFLKSNAHSSRKE